MTQPLPPPENLPAKTENNDAPSDAQPSDKSLHADSQSGNAKDQKIVQERMQKADAQDKVSSVSFGRDKDTPKLLFTILLNRFPPGQFPPEIEKELNSGEFGPKTRTLYARAAKEINDIATMYAENLKTNGIPFPGGCPIEVQEDHNLRALESVPLFAANLKQGNRVSGIKTYGEANETRQRPDRANIDKFIAARQWIDKAADALRKADLDTQVADCKRTIDSLDLGDKAKGWQPPENMTEEQKEDWLNKVSPWLTLIRTTEKYYRKCEDMQVASNAGFANHWSFSRLGAKSFKDVVDYEKDLPGTFPTDASGARALERGQAKIQFDLPNNLDRNEINNQKMQKFEEWLNKVSPPLHQALTEFGAASTNSERACLWGEMPVSEEEKKAEAELRKLDPTLKPTENYNQVQHRFRAESTRVTLIGADGAKHEEDRVRVITTHQKQLLPLYDYQGLFAKNAGAPESSGSATLKIAGDEQSHALETGKTLSLGAQSDIEIKGVTEKHAEVQLTADGRIQIRSQSHGQETFIIKGKDATGSSSEKIAIKNGTWVDLEPGDKVEVGGKQISFSNDVRLYKPTDWVAVAGNHGMQMMQAKDLGAWALEAKAWHYGGKGVSVAMDIGFIVTGTIELKAAKYAVGEGLARTAIRQAELSWSKYAGQKAVLTATEKAAIDSMWKNGKWHLFLGLSAFGHEAIKDTFGKSGEKFLFARNLAMMFDISASNAFLGKSMQKGWSTVIGEADEAKIAQFLSGPYGAKNTRQFSTFGEKLKGTNDLSLKVSDIQMFGDNAYEWLYKEGGEALKRRWYGDKNDAELNMRSAQRAIADRPWPVMESVTQNFLSLSDKKTQEEIRTNQNRALAFKGVGDSPLLQDLKDREVEKLAKTYSSNADQGQKLAALLAIMTMSKRADGSLPETLASYKTDEKTRNSITLSEAESFLVNYRPLKLRNGVDIPRQFSELSSVLKQNVSAENRNLLMDGTLHSLEKKEGQLERSRQLAKIYLESKSSNDKTAAAVGLLLLNANNNGAIPQQLYKEHGWSVSVQQAKSGIVDRRDVLPSKTAAEAVEEVKQFIKGDGYHNQSTDPNQYVILADTELNAEVTANDAVKYLRKQLAESDNISQQLAIADVLHNIGQLSDTELGGVCQSILKNPMSSTEDKISALVDARNPRLLELLSKQKYEIEAPLAQPDLLPAQRALILRESLGRSSLDLQESLLTVAHNNQNDINLRTLALSILHTGNLANSEARTAAIKSLKENGAPLSNADARQNNLFAKQFIDNCAKSLYGQNKEADSYQTRQKQFQAALSLYELGKIDESGLQKVPTNQIYDTLLHCLKIESETAQTVKDASNKLPNNETVAIIKATQGSRQMAARIIPILSANFNELSDPQKAELQKKTRELLNWPNDLRFEKVDLTVQLAALSKIGTIFSGCSPKENDSVRQILENLVNTSSVKLTAGGAAGMHSVEVGLNKDILDTGLLAMQSLCKLEGAEIQAKANAFLTRTFDNKATDPDLRLAALDHLVSREQELSQTYLKLLETEKEPSIRARLENLAKLATRQDVDCAEYKDAFKQAENDLLRTPLALDFAKAREYVLAGNGDITADYFGNARQDSRDPASAKPEALHKTIQELARTAKYNDPAGHQARSALAYIVLSNGRPFFDEHRLQAVKEAAIGLHQLCKDGSPEIKEAVTPIIMRCLADQALLPREATFTLTNALTWLDPGTSGSTITKKEAATALSLALEKELKIMPKSVSDADFKQSQDLQLHLLGLLSRYAGEEQVPVLVALADRQTTSSLERDSKGMVVKVRYPDKSAREVRRNDTDGSTAAFTITRADGSFQTWIKDTKQDAYFARSDLKKEQPWPCTVTLEQDGTFRIIDKPYVKEKTGSATLTADQIDVFSTAGSARPDVSFLNTVNGVGKYKTVSPGGTAINEQGTETVYLPSGGKIERSVLETNGQGAGSIRITYPDGSVRSQVVHAFNGQPLKAGTYIPSDRETDPMKSRPTWLKDVSGYFSSPPDFNYIDFKTGAVVRYDYLYAKAGSQVSAVYKTASFPDGRISCESETFKEPIEFDTLKALGTTHDESGIFRRMDSKSTIAPVLRSAQSDDSSTCSMLLVRNEARRLISQLTENTDALYKAAVVNEKLSPEEASAKLNEVLAPSASTAADSRKVSLAIIEAGLSSPIEDISDPRRATFNNLLKNDNELVRLTASRVLIENSDLPEDKHAAALELADLARTATLVGLRLEAQRLIDREANNLKKQNSDKSSPEGWKKYLDDNVMRFALSSAEEFSTNAIFDGPTRGFLYSLLKDKHESIQLRAASALLASSFPRDQELSANALAALAKQAKNPEIRDEAWKLANANASTNATLAVALAKTPWTDIKPSALAMASQSDISDRRFKERYENAKIEILEGNLRPLLEIQDGWFKDHTNYLTAESFSRAEETRAQSQLWIIERWLKYIPDMDPRVGAPDYEKAQQFVHDKMELAFDELVDLATKTPTNNEESRENLVLKEKSAQARAALCYIILSNGRPFRNETDRTKMTELAAEAILKICQTKGRGAGEMLSLVSDVLISEPAISPQARQTLFSAVKAMVNQNNKVSAGDLQIADAQQIAIKALEATYRTMESEYLPKCDVREKNPNYEKSEKLQLALLDYLKEPLYKRNTAVLTAVAEHSPSASVRQRAQELLRRIDDVEFINLTSYKQEGSTDKAKAISNAWHSSALDEDKTCNEILSRCDTPFTEDGVRVNDPRASALIEALQSPNERVRLAVALGYARCSNKSHIEPPEQVLLALYEMSANGKRPGCREKSAALLNSMWKFKFDSSGELWFSKMQPRLDELLKAKKSRELANRKD